MVFLLSYIITSLGNMYKIKNGIHATLTGKHDMCKGTIQLFYHILHCQAGLTDHKYPNIYHHNFVMYGCFICVFVAAS